MEKVTCSVVFLSRDGWVYLARGRKGMNDGYFNGYGGKQEVGETIAESGIRETLEESGGVKVNPDSLRKICVLISHSDKIIKGLSRPQARTLIVHFYIASKWAGQPKRTEAFEEAIRFDFDKLPLDQMLPNNRYWLAKALRSTQPFVVEVWYETERDGKKIPERFTFHRQPDEKLIAAA
ncbi:MAG: NUDIX domain-containing protein [Candidatus Berkelbacteria bacterium]|nr:NUDIX domain-containing protein [Candidatus Berkelbacteria bacterium]